MPASFKCPKCSQRYAVREQLIGKIVKCQKCGEKFQVPAAQKPAAQAAPGAAAPAKPVAAPSPAPMPDGLPPLPPIPSGPGALPSGAASEAPSLPPLSSGLDDLLDGVAPAPAAPTPAPAASPLAPVAPAKKRAAPARKRASSNLWSLADLNEKDRQRLWSGLGVIVVGLLGFFLPVHRFLGRRGRNIPPSAYPVVSMIATVIGIGLVVWALRKKLAIALPGAGGVLAVMIVCFIVSPYRKGDSSEGNLSAPANQAAATGQVPAGGPQDLASLYREAAAATNRLGDLLAGVQDEPSMRTAIPEVRKTVDGLNVTMERISQLEDNGAELGGGDQGQLSQAMAAATMKFVTQAERIGRNPAFADLTKEIERYNDMDE